MKQVLATIRKPKIQQQLLLLLAGYLLVMWLTRLVSWFSYGAWWRNDHPGLWNIGEMMSSSGAEFLLRFLLTLAMLHFLFLTKGQGVKALGWKHGLGIIFFAGANYGGMLWLQNWMGWASVRTGSGWVWEVYENALFYGAQFALIHCYLLLEKTKYPTPPAPIEEPPLFPKHLVLQKGTRLPLVKIVDIFYLQAHGDYCKVFTATDSFLSPKGISQTAQQLDPIQFQRVHRSYWINCSKVKALKKNGRYFEVILSNEATVRVSQTYLPKIKEALL